QVDVGAGVDVERHASLVGGGAGGLHLASVKVGIASAVLEIDPYRAGLDDARDVGGQLVQIVGEPALEVAAHRRVHGADDLGHHGAGDVHRQDVAIGLAMRPGDRGGRGGDRLG